MTTTAPHEPRGPATRGSALAETASSPMGSMPIGDDDYSTARAGERVVTTSPYPSPTRSRYTDFCNFPLALRTSSPGSMLMKSGTL